MSSASCGDRDMIPLLADLLNGCLQRDVIIVSDASSLAVFGDGLLFLKRRVFSWLPVLANPVLESESLLHPSLTNALPLLTLSLEVLPDQHFIQHLVTKYHAVHNFHSCRILCMLCC